MLFILIRAVLLILKAVLLLILNVGKVVILKTGELLILNTRKLLILKTGKILLLKTGQLIILSARKVVMSTCCRVKTRRAAWILISDKQLLGNLVLLFLRSLLVVDRNLVLLSLLLLHPGGLMPLHPTSKIDEDVVSRVVNGVMEKENKKFSASPYCVVYVYVSS